MLNKKRLFSCLYITMFLMIILSVFIFIIESSTGDLTVTATFGYGSDLSYDTFPEENSIQVRITGPDQYENIVTLSADNNWTETVSHLNYGAYSVIELQDTSSVDGYDLNIAYSNEERIFGLSDSVPNNFIIVSNTYTKAE